MTDPWASPDHAAVQSGALAPYGSPTVAARGFDARREALVAVVLSAVVVLLAAPVGLLWSAVAPHATVVVFAQDSAGFAMLEQETFISSDATFLGLTLLAGVGCGLLAWRLARRHGPAVVVSLVLAGLAAAFVAAEVGNVVGQADFRAQVLSGTPATLEANVRLIAREAVVGWPVGALAGFLIPFAYRRDDPA